VAGRSRGVWQCSAWGKILDDMALLN